MASNVRIEPLSKDNYDTWCMQAQAVLIKAELWEYVCGQKKLEAGASNDDKTAFAKEDIKARSELLLLISPSELKLVKGCVNSKELWDKLKSIYQSTGPARKATLLKQLVLKKMHEKDDIRDQLNNFMDTVSKLADMEVTIHPELLSIMILYSLPSKFENFRVAIESRDVLPSPEDLCVKIKEESEARCGSANNNLPENEAYFSRKYKGTICNICHKKGHIAAKCWKNINKNKAAEKPTKQKNFNVCLNTSSPNKELWCLDSGCTSHMSGHKGIFTEITQERGSLQLASNVHTAEIKGTGKVILKKENITLNKALYVPELSTNLMSVARITENNYTVLFTKEKAFIKDKNKNTVLKADKLNGLYYVKTNELNEIANMMPKSENDIMKWHKKMGHLNEKDLRLIAKNELIKGLTFKEDIFEKCETCIKGKMTSLPFVSIDKIVSNEPLQIVHSDVCGPFENESLAGSRYYVSFTDDYTRYCCIYFIKNKSDVLDKFKEYKNNVEKFLKTKIQNLQTDNGTEYRNRTFDDFLKYHGISRRLSAPYTPQQNGVSERKNRTLMDRARCLMIESKLPANLWAEALYTANYLVNRSPTKLLNGRSPYEKWVGKVPSSGHLHIFGCKAFVLNKKKRGKFSPKGTEGVFVGYAKNAKGFRVYLPSENTVIISRDVKFIDDKMYYDVDVGRSYDDFVHELKNSEKTQSETEKRNINLRKNKKMEIEFDNTNTLFFQEALPIQQDLESPGVNEEEEAQSEEEWTETEEVQNLPSLNERPRRERRLPVWTKDYVTSEMENNYYEPETTYLCNEKGDWHEAIKAEIRAHILNETWVIKMKEKNMRLVDNKMILKTKIGPDDKEIKKARLVARGFTQRIGFDYNETFAPVARLTSIRSVIAMSVEKGYNLCQMDVTTAYLNGDIEEDIMMKIPENLEEYVAEIMVDESEKEDLSVYQKARKMLEDLKSIKEEKVCKLQRALYGLKQSGRQWYEKLDSELKKIGFISSPADPCVHILEKGGEKVIVTVYVDDFLIAYSCSNLCTAVKEKLMKIFQMKDMGRPKRMIGIEFSYYDDGNIKLSQDSYIERILEEYNMKDCKQTSTPIEPRLNLKKSIKIDEKLPYKNLMGALMFLAVTTRPDIMYACSYLSQFNDFYVEEHYKCLKRVLRYLKGTKNEGLKFMKTGSDIYGMADADWGADKEDRRSFSGYCFKYGGACISWATKKQRCVALSTAEAEYVSITEAAKEAVHLHSLFSSLGLRNEKKVLLLSDNQAAIKLGTNPIISSKSKHMDLKLHFIRDCIKNGQISLQYLSTKEMEADIFTKGVPGPRLLQLRRQLGIVL